MIGFRHAGIYVKDLKKLKAFYKSVFDLADVVHQIEKGSFTDTLLGGDRIVIEVCKMKFESGIIIELIELQNENEPPHEHPVFRTGEGHIAVTVSSADDMVKRVKTYGGSLVNMPAISPDGKVKAFFAKDPEGNYIEIVEELE